MCDFFRHFWSIFGQFRVSEGCSETDFRVPLQPFDFNPVLALILMLFWSFPPWDYIVKYESKCMFSIFDFVPEYHQEDVEKSMEICVKWLKKGSWDCITTEMARKSSSRIKICAMARVFSIFGRLWDALGIILARGNPSPEAPKAVRTFENIDLDGPEAVWMLSHDFLAQNCKICVNFCILWDSMAAIFFRLSWNFGV